MPLRITWRNGRAYIRGTVRGQSVYEAAGTTKRAEAEILRAKREAELYEASVLGARAVVSFQRAALSYLQFEERSEATKFYVARLVKHFGTLPLAKVNDQEAADIAVDAIVGTDAAPATKNRGVLTPLIAILTHAAHRKWCDRPQIQKRKVPKSATPWLTPRQALALIDAASPHLKPLLRFLFCTGARLSEALDLMWSDVDLGAARVIFRGTKAQVGQEKDRVASLPPEAVAALANLPAPEDGVRTGPVFLRDDGEPYADRERAEGGQIRTAWATACRRAGLIRWVECKSTKLNADGPFTPVRWVPLFTPHACRHSFASWFYLLTKDAMLLRDEGGWSSLAMVERYAHRAGSEIAEDVALIWGLSHPKIGALPTRQGGRGGSENEARRNRVGGAGTRGV